MNTLGNPIQCSRETLSFLQWMDNTKAMFVRFNDYTCIYNDELITFDTIGQLLKTLNYQCSLDLILKVYASLLAFLITVIALSFFLYRHKWDLRFFCLRFITNMKAYQKLQQWETDIEYDAYFVVHDKNDFDWVSNELNDNLDSKMAKS